MNCLKCGCYIPKNHTACPSCGKKVHSKASENYSVTINLNGETTEAYIADMKITYEQLPSGIIRKFNITAIEYEPIIKTMNRGD